jgi:hypothetical protein
MNFKQHFFYFYQISLNIKTMKTKLMLIIFLAFLLNACNVGVKTDLLTGLKTSYNGISCENAYLTLDNTKISSNQFEFGKIYHLNLNGVNGFTLKDGKVNLGAAIVVTDASGSKVVDFPDLFEQYTTEGITAEQAASLDLSIKILEKYKAGEKYNWKSKVWDKNGKGIINAEVSFVVK